MTYSLTLGPFHSAWRGPQRFIIELNGEVVTAVDHHSGLNERGCAERIKRLPLSQTLRFVPRICGTCGHAHMLAYCHAVEQLAGLTVPIRAQHVRVIVAELERIIMHMAGAANLCEVLGVDYYVAPLRQHQHDAQTLLLEIIRTLDGEHILMPGGLAFDPTTAAVQSLQSGIIRFIKDLYQSIDHIIDDRRLVARTVEVGSLAQAAASQLEVGGIVARASGLLKDIRFTLPYATYQHIDAAVVVQESGDIYARLMVMLLESHESAKMVDQTTRIIKVGPWEGSLPVLHAGIASGSAEGPRGLITYVIQSDGVRISECEIRVSRQLDRLVARSLLHNAQFDDVLAIIASTDTCTACAEC